MGRNGPETRGEAGYRCLEAWSGAGSELLKEVGPGRESALLAVHVAFISFGRAWWGCASPVSPRLWRWESSVRCRVRMSASGGDTGSGADLRVTVGAVGFALIF
jgi:hypothetical protein